MRRPVHALLIVVLALGSSGAVAASEGLAEADGAMLDGLVRRADGALTIRTGARHPATLALGVPRDVLAGGALGRPTSSVSWRVFDATGRSVVLRPTAPRATILEPGAVRIEWTASPWPGLTLELAEEVAAFGTTMADSGVRITLEVRNTEASRTAARIGVGWRLDFGLDRQDGDRGRRVPCATPDRAVILLRDADVGVFAAAGGDVDGLAVVGAPDSAGALVASSGETPSAAALLEPGEAVARTLVVAPSEGAACAW